MGSLPGRLFRRPTSHYAPFRSRSDMGNVLEVSTPAPLLSHQGRLRLHLQERRSWPGLDVLPHSPPPGYYVYRQDIEPSADPSIQQKVDAQNAKIAARPPHPRPGANVPGNTGRKSVRFNLPKPRREPRFKESLTERFERLDMEEAPKRCRLCGHRLSGGYRHYAPRSPGFFLYKEGFIC